MRTSESTARVFLKDLRTQATDPKRQRVSADDSYIGVRMGAVFALAKTHMNMPLEEIEKLLESPIDEARVGAVIMDYQVRLNVFSDVNIFLILNSGELSTK